MAAEFKLLIVIDEHSRLCLAIQVGRRCKAKGVVTMLDKPTILFLAQHSSDPITGLN